MQGSWFYKYQPKTIDEYVFQDDQMKEKITSWINNETIDGNVLFYGPPGTGKTALCEIIIKNIIKTQGDLNRIRDRSVANIDELYNWLQKRPIKSKIKIVYLEEFDKISRQAMDSLKDGKMEKYQEYVAFICTSNYIRKIDPAIQTRFTHKFNLRSTNVAGVSSRLKQILTQEEIEFNEEELYKFTEKNINIGLRDLINTLHINSFNKKLDLKNVILQNSDQEKTLVEQTLNIIKTILTSSDYNSKRLCFINPLNSDISPFYSSIIDITQYNFNLDYSNVFAQLDEEIHFLPIKVLINKYESELDSKRMPHIHYLAFICEVMECINETV
jgi:DNA polymerase III delta prime subunit